MDKLTLKKSPCSDTMICADITNPSESLRQAIYQCIRDNFNDSPVYLLKLDAQPFLQCDSDDYMLIEFWSDDEASQQKFVDAINGLAN